MPRDMVISDSDADAPRAKQKDYSSKKKRAIPLEPEHASESEEALAEEGSKKGSEEEEEYEIEEVLDSQKGYFGDGKFGYFVKWIGYGEEENSWVHEDDAENALDLINKYWENKRKASKGGPRKSADASKHKPNRVSSAVRETRELSPPPKKRARSKKEEQELSEKEPEANSDDDDARTKKKPRKSLGGGSSKKVKVQLADDEEEVIVGSMKKHMTIASWENLVDTIDTVERGEGDKLYVYFKIKNGNERMRELSNVCAQKFPQKLIKFYESNLRWRIEGEDAD